MGIFIMGGDYIETIKKELKRLGAGNIYHVSGRKVQDARRKIPADTELVVVLCDFLNHNAVKALKARAREGDIPVIFVRRSLGNVMSSVKQWMEKKGYARRD